MLQKLQIISWSWLRSINDYG